MKASSPQIEKVEVIIGVVMTIIILVTVGVRRVGVAVLTIIIIRFVTIRVLIRGL